MRISQAQAFDWESLNDLYRRNRPDAKCALVGPRSQSQALVAKDDGHDNTIIGFVLASYDGRKPRRYGAIHVLEIEPDDREPLLERALIQTCVAWLAAQGCTSAQVPALGGPEYAWLRRELGAESGTSDPIIPLVPCTPKWHWALDPETGTVYPEAGPEGTPLGVLPSPVQAASQVWN